MWGDIQTDKRPTTNAQIYLLGSFYVRDTERASAYESLGVANRDGKNAFSSANT